MAKGTSVRDQGWRYDANVVGIQKPYGVMDALQSSIAAESCIMFISISCIATLSILHAARNAFHKKYQKVYDNVCFSVLR